MNIESDTANQIANQIEIIYEDEFLVAINKEAGLLVHRSWLDKGETRFAMQLTRDAVGCHVFPVHRLDKPTSGVLLFAKSSAVARSLTEAFTEHKVTKQYLAVVRGYMSEQGTVDYALSFQPDAIADKFANLDKPAQEAVTHWQSLAQIELPFAVSKKHDTSRYSLMRLTPETGRKHQLRRHMRHLFHHIVGDTSHGDGRHNRFFRTQYGCARMLLHAQTLALSHPVTGEPLLLKAGLDDQWLRIMEEFAWVESAKV
ncbi:tRNA pseudouridine(65) synthase TruC [Psychrobacter cryohalolentis]|uniref:tRNA pseudouridine synthase C n=1 Tax=Psychrobacter cryohalolentis (strain ATCC BAA-1226 / DSM 17306 / VKM B-2378 / K5) TaxID=335284 RepID=Q1Q9Q5_PSYCK|nr:tRNA pseudouridine(65) synthase TruC [Psychrobacter cryohalolentis]ABE75598.1 tRNA pseudouridine synthase C [Psychrobacter cryohalolentis K5]ASE25788.1 tRNA pseudouridine(65) synthase TruC [Psychrobacter cryohalolentis]